MEVLFEELSSKSHCNIHLLTSPKYHCELAGEGVEYVWGLFKRHYRSIAFEEKKGKDKFEKAIRECVSKVTKEHVNLFSAKCRRYMLAYKHKAREREGGETQLTYEGIERFVKRFRCHRSTADQDTGFIARVWRESVR